MKFIGPRAEFNCPRCARAITISPRADKFHIALLLMLLLILIVYLLRQLFPYRPTNMMKSAHPGRLILNSPPGQLRINRPG